jgi:hypothetical protein
VCQVSLFDLDLGIPVIVRNKLLHLQQEDYKSSTRRWYNNGLLDRRITEGEAWLDRSLRDRIRQIDPVLVHRVRQLVDSGSSLIQEDSRSPEWLSNECRHRAPCFTRTNCRPRLPGVRRSVPLSGNGRPKRAVIDARSGGVRPARGAATHGGGGAGGAEPEELSLMTPPAPEEIFEIGEPLGYPGIDDIDLTAMPKYVGGRLIRD